MIVPKYSCVTVSALTLALAFWQPTFFWWLIFFFLAPLAYAALFDSQYYGFVSGLWFGVLFFTLHWYGFMYLLLERGQGTARYWALVLLILYASLHAGLWFWLVKKISAFYATSLAWCALVWSITTIGYFWWVRTALWWPLGMVQGYCFSWPLLPLMSQPRLLMLLPIMTEYGLLICLVVNAVIIAVAIKRSELYLVLVALLWLIPFMYGWVCPASIHTIPTYLESLGYIRPPSNRRSLSPLDLAQYYNSTINDYIALYPHTTLLLMPEGAYPYPLHDAVIIDLLSHVVRSDEVSIVLGARKICGNKSYNSLFCVRNSVVIATYDKTILMPFTEFIPPHLDYSTLRNLFMRNNKDFIPQDTTWCPLHLAHGVTVYPALCTDLFLGNRHTKSPCGTPLLFLVNDSWFSASYMRQLMLLYTRYIALAYQRNIIYVGYNGAYWLGKGADVLALKEL